MDERELKKILKQKGMKDPSKLNDSFQVKMIMKRELSNEKVPIFVNSNPRSIHVSNVEIPWIFRYPTTRNIGKD